MHRVFFFGVLVVGSLTTLNCQSHTAGLQQGSSRADEGATMAHMRAIARAQSAYNISNPGEFGTFEQLAKGGYLDHRFNTSQPKYYGYVFTMTVSPKSGSTEGSYGLNADPDPALKATGRHLYFGSNSFSIHVNPNQPANVSDETVAP